MISKPLPLIALAAMLALGACNTAPKTTDNAEVNVGDATGLGDTPANDESPVIENVGADATEAVAIAAVPTPAADTPAAQAAPLTEAGTIEKEIRAGTGIQRVRYGEGWAWTRSGKILRTADRDGKNIAYFRGGGDKPFFVQQGDHSYAYQGDKPVRAFDHDGRASMPDADHSKQAQQAAHDAATQRDHAEKAWDHAKPGDGKGEPRDQHDRDHPSPTPSPSPTARDHDRGGDRDHDRKGDGRD